MPKEGDSNKKQVQVHSPENLLKVPQKEGDWNADKSTDNRTQALAHVTS